MRLFKRAAKIVLSRSLIIFLSIFVVTLTIDQAVKQLFLNGYRWDSKCITLSLVYNKGVAFSMFEFLGAYLKYIQIAMLSFMTFFLFQKKERFATYGIGLSIIIGAGSSNVLDRFLHIGVVDYVYWHCGFDFAIFNLADVLIDVGIVLLLYKILREK